MKERVRLKATKDQTYGSKRILRNEEFLVTPRDARILLSLNRAIICRPLPPKQAEESLPALQITTPESVVEVAKVVKRKRNSKENGDVQDAD